MRGAISDDRPYRDQQLSTPRILNESLKRAGLGMGCEDGDIESKRLVLPI